MSKLYKSVIAAAAILLTTASMQARPLVVAGNLLTSDTQGAVYEITSDGSKTILTNPAYATSYAASGGGCYNDGKYYMSKIWMSGYSSQTYTFDTSEIPWKTVNTDGNGSSSVLSTDYSYDTEANVIYGFIKYSGTNYKIGKITPGSSWSTRYVQVQVGTDMKDVTIDCSNAENKWHGIAFDADNQLWVITYGGALNKVDKNTGAMTLVGETGIKPTVNGSAAFDFKTGKLYWAVKNADGSSIYEVDLTTASATKVMDVPDNQQLMGLYIPEPAADDAAPAAPTNVRYDFTDGSLEGNLLFDIPATTFDDQPAEGNVTYSVTVGNNDPISGTVEYGQTNVTVPFSVTASGKVTVSIYLENSVGKSPTVKYESYIGYGKPVAPANVTLDYADGKMILSWDAVTSVVDNHGYLGEVKYNVTRSCNGTSESVATDLTSTSFEEAVAEPESGLFTYSYSVTAANAEFVSASATSASRTLGSIALPYVNDFATTADFNSLTNINCEAGSSAWYYSSGSAAIKYDRAYTKDDWLISPPFKIKKGCEYTVSIDAKSNSANYPEKVGLSWGFEPAAEGMSNVLVAGDEDVPTTYTTDSGSFVAEADGIAYAGIHACSPKDMSTLYVDNFKIEMTAEAPKTRPVIVRGNLMTSETAGAVYEITSDGSKTILTNPSYASMYAASGGGCYNDGKYYMSKIWMSGYSAQTYTFDTAEVPWTTLSSDASASSTMLSTDYSYDTETNVIYGFMKQSGNNYVIGKITPGSSWSRKLVQVQVGTDMKDVTIDCSNAENKWHGIAFDADNQLWVITFGGSLNKVDKNTGAMTLVGETGIKPTVNGSAAFDFKTGKLYWAVKNAEGSFVYEVNTTSAEATKVIDVPDNLQMAGLYIPAPAAEDGAPAAPENVRYDFEGGSLEGNLLFDVPATTFDGEKAQGDVTYSVTIAGNEPITGTAAFGQTNVAVPFSVSASGNVAVNLYLENEVGPSPVVKYEAYVGYGTPVAPANVTLDYTDGKMMLSWDAVTSVVDDLGYLGDVKYNVTRTANGTSETVAEEIAATDFEEEISEPESGLATYSYSVIAVNGDRVSSAATSSNRTLGSIALPYVNDFTTQEDFNSLTNINCQPESKAWTWSKSSGYVSIGYDKSYTKDDWLISPPFKIRKGCEYTVSIEARSSSSGFPERVGLSWGYEPTVEGMSEVLVAGDEDVPGSYTTYSGTFTAASNGIAYAGIHACSKEDMSTLIVDNFKIEETIPSGIEGAADNGICIKVDGNVITVEGIGHVAIVSIDGTLLADMDSNGIASASVAPGIYIVSLNGRSTKVIAR